MHTLHHECTEECIKCAKKVEKEENKKTTKCRMAVNVIFIYYHSTTINLLAGDIPMSFRSATILEIDGKRVVSISSGEAGGEGRWNDEKYCHLFGRQVHIDLFHLIVCSAHFPIDWHRCWLAGCCHTPDDQCYNGKFHCCIIRTKSINYVASMSWEMWNN